MSARVAPATREGMGVQPVIATTKARGNVAGDAAAALVLALGGLALVLGVLSVASNALEAYPAPLLGAMGLALAALLAQEHRARGVWDRRLAMLAGLSLLAGLTLSALPVHITGLQVNGIVHRSLLSATMLVGIGVPAISLAIYYLLGATPRAEDMSRYPLIVVPAVLVLGVYGLVLVGIAREGLANLDLQVLLTPYRVLHWREEVWIDDWPVWVDRSVSEVGMLNHIAGTALLVALTAVVATPIGVSVGVYVSEYGSPRLVSLVRASTSLLRAVSPFVIGLLAVEIVRQASGTFLSDPLAGYYMTVTGVKRSTSGSFLLAAMMISLLVVPVIARATEEGCRSLPRELREASWALGATHGYTLRRIILPWSLPSIVTGVLLACAEAAGDMAIIMFMAGSGDFGVGPFQQVTSLAYLIFGAQYGVSKAFRGAMRPYQFSAAILLLVFTVGLTVLALILKRRFAGRYRGA